MTSFASESWATELATALQDSAAVRTASVTWLFGPIRFVVDANDEFGVKATAVTVDVHEGTVRGVSAGPTASAGLAPFAIGGSLDRWKSVFGGQLSIVDAILDSRLRAEGDLPTLARHRDLLVAIAKSGGELTTEWPQERTEAGATA